MIGAPLLLIYAIIDRPEKPQKNEYYVVKEYLQNNVQSKIIRLVPPTGLHYERLDNFSFNVYGWFIYSNQNTVLHTQWFRLKIGGDGAYVVDRKFYRSDPLTNLTSSTPN
jgi:hypothetical protein